jgi:isopenicillin-N epimerase
MMTSTQSSLVSLSNWELNPEVRFLNHGSFGACPRELLAKQSEYRTRLERDPIAFMARELHDKLEAARVALAAFVGADAAGLAFVSNATTGVNAVLRSMELQAGDEIVVSNHGYNACNNAVTFVCERAGAQRRIAQIPFPIESPEQVLAGIRAQLSERTRLVLIDHITSPTGLVLPIEQRAGELRERGIEMLVDGAHAPGMLALDLDALGAAYYTGNCHKWMCAPKGAAFLWVREDLRDSVRPAVISHGANAPLLDGSRYLMEFDWVGTDDPTALLTIPDAIEYFERLVPGGWDEVRRHNRELALAGRAVLLAALGLDSPAPDEMIGSLASLFLPPGETTMAVSAWDVDPLQRALYEHDHIEVPIMPWPAPPSRILRISAQLYNSLDDYEQLARALQARLP